MPIVAAVGAPKDAGVLPTAVAATAVVPGLGRPILPAGAVALPVQPVVAVRARQPGAPPLAVAAVAVVRALKHPILPVGAAVLPIRLVDAVAQH